MTVAEATPDLEQVDRHDRAFLGHPKGLGFLGFTEACERFSYYSMQTLLTLYMVNYLLLAGHIEGVAGLGWLRAWHYPGLEGHQEVPEGHNQSPGDQSDPAASQLVGDDPAKDRHQINE